MASTAAIRRWGRCLVAGLAVVGLTAACAHRGPDAAGPVCRYQGLTFQADFPAGRLNGCRRRGENAYTLYIEPEDQPINPSPWYAFRVSSDKPRELRLTLDYGEARHRYHPKLHSACQWRPLPTEVKLTDGRTRASFRLTVETQPLTVAAQPLITPEHERAWMERLAAATAFATAPLGRSAEGRDIVSLASLPGSAGTVVITGRQHPPEVTGAQALHAFVERLAKDDPLARNFRRRFGVFVVPLLNPDGVVHGHWRHDSAGTDLNRDWGPFRRPETRALRDAMAELARSDHPPILVLDFHSTWRDVLYTQPDTAAGPRAGFPGAWHRAINARLEGSGLERTAGHNPGKPTLKTWAHQTYRVPAITVELGDRTALPRIHRTAAIAAEEMMRLLL